MGINWGDILYAFFAILTAFSFIAIIIFVVQATRRSDQRAKEKLQLEQQQAAIQQQQNKAIDDLNKRLTRLENMLKEVE